VSQPTHTPDQERALAAEGNVLVLAGAGTGKTHTLVARCLSRVLHPTAPVSLDQVLLVTFTEAAATEMRRRIRQCLDEALRRAPGDLRLLEQIALVDTARISTLHSLCYDLVREHFHDLGLDPQVAVLPEAPAVLLAHETLGRVLRGHYAGTQPADDEVRQLVLDHGGRSDAGVRELVLRIQRYTQTLPEPSAWLGNQEALLASAEPVHWLAWLLPAVAAWRRDWLESLEELAGDNPNAALALAALRAAGEQLNRGEAVALLERVLAVDESWPTSRKTVLREPLKELFAESRFLLTLADGGEHRLDPMVEDWRWVQPHMRALLRLTGEFATAFAEAKRAQAAVDFPDLEQLALRLLWDGARHRPTALAEQWRARFRFVFVDEYQDINAAQDQVLQALSREGAEGNRFLVGDLKQSIYRFRLADPRICQSYATRWQAVAGQGTVIPLTANFRSQAGVLEFVNAVFAALMRPELGGVGYDEDARLRFHHPASKAAPRPSREGKSVALDAGEAARVEFLLRVANRTPDEPETATETGGIADISGTEKEAVLVARRLLELRNEQWPVWDNQTSTFRPVQWRDMVILLRAPRRKAEGFAKVFDRLGLPLVTPRGGLYEALEVRDLLNLLRLLDNPLQDLPLLAVLRSPIVGMTLDELALLRSETRAGEFWTALRRFHQLHRQDQGVCRALPDESGVPRAPWFMATRRGQQADFASQEAPAPATTPQEGALFLAVARSAWERADTFLARFTRWRALARRGSLSRCLEAVLAETHYEDWLTAQPPGEQARANVQRLLALTREFEQLPNRGLFRFLRFVEAQLEAEFDPEPAAVEGQDAVRLMSVHQSKGLEFPVVVVADLGKPFNFQDLRSNIVMDETFGLCPRVKPGRRGCSYPSLPYWLAVRRQTREFLGEELRLLYVAMTRACDRLILCGTTSPRTIQHRWPAAPSRGLSLRALLAARHWLDWLGPLLPQLAARTDWFAAASGESRLLRWQCFEQDELGSLPASPQTTALDFPAEQDLLASRDRLAAWTYPQRAATVEPAKTSVTALRRRVVDEADADSAPWFRLDIAGEPGPVPAGGALTAAERGTAHHRFLQFARPERSLSQAGVRAEAERLEALGALTAAEVAALDFVALARFWQSPLGTRVLAQSGFVQRELEFTVRLSPADLRALPLTVPAGPWAEDEFVVVQGVVDLAVISPTEIWIVDFKTDALAGAGLAAKTSAYAPQLALYALALGRIYRRPVTESWLHFLALDRNVRVSPVDAEAPAEPPSAPA
jgi:ATP-dependent helicase/nuclease subunit A